jgi:hypothetical protein
MNQRMVATHVPEDALGHYESAQELVQELI